MQLWVFSVSNVWVEIHHSVLRYLWSVGLSLSTPLLISVWQTKFIQDCLKLLNSKKSLKCKMITWKCFLKMVKCELEMQDLRMLRNAARRSQSWKVTKWKYPTPQCALAIKYYPRPPCTPSFIKSRMLCPLQTHFLLFQQIFFILVWIHVGNPKVPPRVLASGHNPVGAIIIKIKLKLFEIRII